MFSLFLAFATTLFVAILVAAHARKMTRLIAASKTLASLSFVQGLALGICVAGTLVVGVMPEVFVRLGNLAASAI